MSRDRELTLQSIELGLEAEIFIESKLGKFLIGRARDEAIEAVDTLKIIDPNESNSIRELQNIIYRAEHFEIWLIEAINIGKTNEEQLSIDDKPD